MAVSGQPLVNLKIVRQANMLRLSAFAGENSTYIVLNFVLKCIALHVKLIISVSYNSEMSF